MSPSSQASLSLINAIGASGGVSNRSICSIQSMAPQALFTPVHMASHVERNTAIMSHMMLNQVDRESSRLSQ